MKSSVLCSYAITENLLKWHLYGVENDTNFSTQSLEEIIALFFNTFSILEGF